MTEADAHAAAGLLVRGRGKVLGEFLVPIARERRGSSPQDLIEELATAPRRLRSSIGLLLARLILEEATASKSRSRLNDFLFRFAAHLQASVNDPGVSVAAQQVLVEAAGQAFVRLPTATRGQLQSIEEMKGRIGDAGSDDDVWRAALGLTAGQYAVALEAVVAYLPAAPASARDSRSTVRSTQPAVIGPQPSVSHAVTQVAPTWLRHVPLLEHSDVLVMATANWSPERYATANAWEPSVAWHHFLAGDAVAAAQAAAPLLGSLGVAWAPNTTADGLRLWHWLRLCVELEALHTGKAVDRRRSATSAYTLCARCCPDSENLLAELLAHSMDDFVASDISSAQAWTAYAARIVEASGHEAALSGYDNRRKAELRALWADRHVLNAEEARNTASVTEVLLSRYHEATRTLYTGARRDGQVGRLVRVATRTLSPFLDEGEQTLLRQAERQVAEAEQSLTADQRHHSVLTENVDGLSEVLGDIAQSSSLVLQDYISPLVKAVADRAILARERLQDTSRPQVVVRLESPRLPFSATPGTRYPLRLALANTGNASAEEIQVRVTNADLSIDATTEAVRLEAGAEERVEILAVATGKSPHAVQIECVWTWTDALLQTFQGSSSFSAEDQRPASWTPTDVNPFSLGTISDPVRLVGREDDLASLEALLAGGGSAYITGHKRVGKTSLARVLLKRTRQERQWAGEVLSLGRALGPEQSAADLVYAMLDEIFDAIMATYSDCSDLPEAVPDPNGNFARSANRWLRAVARHLPAHARVVLAIDDFDELPSHLVSGQQADALFLFLRTLVDEPWLNLVLVGSEVLPTVIANQSHKLNQVVPVSVTNFSSRASSAALLVPPTADRLEWDASAINRAHFISRGNPYYETLVAQQLWLDLRERSRSFVTEADVDSAATTVAETAPASHFVHLWADSATGIDHTSRRAIVTSAVLRAVARCGGVQSDPAQVEEVVRVAQTWIQSAPEAELQQVVNTLIGRNVLERGATDRSVLMSIPLVSVWLAKAGGRALDRDYASSAHANATARVVTESDLAALSRGLVYRGEPISEIRIKAWLSQFGDNYHQYLAYQMLRRMVPDGYFTSGRMHDKVMPKLRDGLGKLVAARQVVRDNNGYMKNAYLLEHGASGDSTQGTISALCKTLKIKKANVVASDELATKMKLPDTGVVLFVLDDFCGSGQHLQTTLDDVLERLPSVASDWAERVHIVVGAAVTAASARLPKSPLAEVTVENVEGLTLGPRFRAFHEEAGIFDTDKERVDARELTTTIGRALLPNNPLGFGQDALLALFEFNCPNNVAPIFWRRGTYAGRDWFPLFERAV